MNLNKREPRRTLNLKPLYRLASCGVSVIIRWKTPGSTPVEGWITTAVLGHIRFPLLLKEAIGHTVISMCLYSCGMETHGNLVTTRIGIIKYIQFSKGKHRSWNNAKHRSGKKWPSNRATNEGAATEVVKHRGRKVGVVRLSSWSLEEVSEPLFQGLERTLERPLN